MKKEIATAMRMAMTRKTMGMMSINTIITIMEMICKQDKNKKIYVNIKQQ